MFRTAPFLFLSCRLWPHYRLLFELPQLCRQLRMLTRGIDLLFDCRYLHKICAAMHTTWCGSAKLAFIFPGFSFVTGLVLCNSQRFFPSRVLLLDFGKLLSIKKKCHCLVIATCRGFTMNCQNMSVSKSLLPDIHPLLVYMPQPTQ